MRRIAKGELDAHSTQDAPASMRRIRRGGYRGLRTHMAGPSTCQWLAGDGPFSDADKCGRPTAPGKPYCQEHAERARLRLGDDGGGDQ